uniref:DUF4220 domain-containing protein n=1 Tax=Leersia perrieri TaxID=77586 RepID=A0A0D9WYQ0_9ORYZ
MPRWCQHAGGHVGSEGFCSGWTWAFFRRRDWVWLQRLALLPLRLVHRERDRRRWSLAMGQLNLFCLCEANSKNNLYCSALQDSNILSPEKSIDLNMMRTWIRLKHWWTMTCHSLFVTISEGLMDMVATKLVPSMGQYRGRNTLETWGLYEKLGWSVGNKNLPLDLEEWNYKPLSLIESILLWHMATDVYLQSYREEIDQDGETSAVAKTAISLSNYMFFLVIWRQHMLPQSFYWRQYEWAVRDLTLFMQGKSAKQVTDILLGREDFNKQDFHKYEKKVNVSTILEAMISRELGTSCYGPNDCHTVGGDPELCGLRNQNA